MLLEDGPLKDRVLAVGGCCKGAGSLSSSELYTPPNNSWTTTGTNPPATSMHLSKRGLMQGRQFSKLLPPSDIPYTTAGTSGPPPPPPPW